jgi:glyoxylase-like metal-dependent hydrolase (beta-lactamase superfamily II)
MKPFVLLFVLLIIISPQEIGGDDDELPLLPITENIYLISGNGGNVAFLTTKEGVLVVDCKMFPYHGEEVVSKISHITDKKIKYLVYTHYHGDHTQGAQNFPPSTVIISHSNTRKNMETMGLSRIEADKTLHFPGQLQKIQAKVERLKAEKNQGFQEAEKELKMLKSRIRDYDRLKLILPHMTIEKKAVLYLGKQRVELMYLGEAHTNGDLLVCFPRERTLHMGDVLLHFAKTESMNKDLMMERVKNMTDGETLKLIRTLESWVEILKEITEMEGVENFIPGHGEIMDRKSFLAQTEYLRDLKRRVVEFQRKRKNSLLYE